jgi:hypothetical protein
MLFLAKKLEPGEPQGQLGFGHTACDHGIERLPMRGHLTSRRLCMAWRFFEQKAKS